MLLGLALTTAVQAQAPRGVHRMEINNGSRLTVRYFGGSPGEASSLRDLERAENESIYVASLQELKRQYVTDERNLAAQRRLVEQQLYATTIAASTGGGYGYGGLGYTEVLAGFGYPALARLGGYYGGVYAPSYTTGYGAGYVGLGGIGATGSLSRALAATTLQQGPLQTSMAQLIAREGTEAYAASVDRSLDRAVAVVGGSPRLQKDLGLPSARNAYNPALPAGFETGPVTVILNDGTRIVGSRKEENKDWITIHTRSGTERVRLSEVKRITESKDGKVVPAN
jgi:hypothetical protein